MTLTDGMTMPLTGTCVFVLKVMPTNRAVNLSSMEDVSVQYVQVECTLVWLCVLFCRLCLISMGLGARCVCVSLYAVIEFKLAQP